MTVPGNLSSPLLATAADAAAAAAGPIKSLRLNSGDSAYLNRTFSSAGNRKTWTWAGWVKKNRPETFETIFSAAASATGIFLANTGGIIGIDGTYGGTRVLRHTTAVFRDLSAWYHLVVALDTTQATDSDRLKLYVNGSEVDLPTATDGTWPAQNSEGSINNNINHAIGQRINTGDAKCSCYIADVYFIDGSALDPTSFGSFDDSGVWQAAAYTGTYGTNGFHLLDFANESTVGHDSSGNNNDFTANNITTSLSNWDQSQTWSDDLAATSSGAYFATGAEAVDAFDGNLNNSAISEPNGSTITWSPNGGITVSSSLRIYRGSDTTSNTVNVSVNGGSSQSFGRSSWVDLGFTGTLTSLAISSPAANPGLSAVEVDGSILVDSGVVDPLADDLDVLFDVPTNGDQSDTGAGGEVSGNYCTWNPLSNGLGGTIANGNLELSGVSALNSRINSTIGVSSGKYYFEVLLDTAGNYSTVGIGQGSITDQYPGEDASSYAYDLENGNGISNDTDLTLGSDLVAGDIFMCAFDLDNNKVFFGKNGTFFGSGNPATGANPAYTISAGTYHVIARPNPSGYGSGGVLKANFGARSFAYSAPSGYKALCTTNLPTPTIADGSDYFEAKTYTGNGSTQTISLPFSPDLVWVKGRSTSNDHELATTVQPLNKALASNISDAEFNTVIEPGTDSFFLDGTSIYANENNATYISWNWNAGSSTVSNTDGSITSQVRASQTAGMSVVSYTGSGSTATVGHGLNAALDFVIIKRRNTTGEWRSWHSALSNTQGIDLNSTGAAFTDDSFNNTIPTSSVFTVKGGVANVNASSSTYLALCFSAVAGYSAFGSYTGNGSSTDGPFVHLGFRPALIIFRNTGGPHIWGMYDSARDTYNVADEFLRANGSDAAGTAVGVDFLSNGFKIRGLQGFYNQSGATILYMAWAENPFQANGGLAR